MNAPTAKTRRALPVADLLITLGLSMLFATALVTSTEWSVKAALFPRFVTGLGLALSLLHLAVLAVRAVRSPRYPEQRAASQRVSASQGEGNSSLGDGAAHGGGSDADVEYVFAQAGRAGWARSLAWVTAFFVLFFGVGLYITAPLFAFAYLRLSAGKSWVFSAAYAAVTWGVLYGALEYGLKVSTPQGAWL